MQKKAFTIIEVVVVFLLVLGVTFFILPKSLDSTKQARLISKWTTTYSDLEYMFSVIKAQKDSEIKEKIKDAANDNDRSEVLLDAIKPYLRITSKVEPNYKQYYMNGVEAYSNGRYHFKDFYYAGPDEIIGLKWVNADCKDDQICAVMSFDINGTAKPNTWGFDVFGINVLKSGIEPIGKNTDPEILKEDCSRFGLGTSCSYYYLIGGRFE